MKVYNYHPETGEYTGESEASIDPMASKREDKEVYLLPANATFEKPTLEAGKAAVNSGSKWTTVEIVQAPVEEEEPIKVDPIEELIQNEIVLFLRETAIQRLTAKGLLTEKEI